MAVRGSVFGSTDGVLFRGTLLGVGENVLCGLPREEALLRVCPTADATRVSGVRGVGWPHLGGVDRR